MKVRCGGGMGGGAANCVFDFKKSANGPERHAISMIMQYLENFNFTGKSLFPQGTQQKLSEKVSHEITKQNIRLVTN